MVAIGLAVCGCGMAASTGVALSRAYAEGDSWVHEMTMVTSMEHKYPDSMDMTGIDISPLKASQKLRITGTVTDVADGVITILMEVVPLEATFNGERMNPSELGRQTVVIKIDSTGRTLSIDAPAFEDTYADLQELFGDESGSSFDWSKYENSILYPQDGTARVGEEWSYESESPFVFPGTEETLVVMTRARLSSLFTDGERQIATIDYTMDAPLDLTIDMSRAYQQLRQNSGLEVDKDLVVKMSITGRYE